MRGSMLVAHIAEGDDVLAWLAGALARCVPLVLECAGGVQAPWGAERRTKESEMHACLVLDSFDAASNIAVKLAVERSVV